MFSATSGSKGFSCVHAACLDCLRRSCTEPLLCARHGAECWGFSRDQGTFQRRNAGEKPEVKCLNRSLELERKEQVGEGGRALQLEGTGLVGAPGEGTAGRGRGAGSNHNVKGSQPAGHLKERRRHPEGMGTIPGFLFQRSTGCCGGGEQP